VVFSILFDLTFKISIFGNAGFGKTSLARRYLTDFFDKEIKVTVGVNIGIKNFNINDKKVSLQIWDFGGEDRFRFYIPIYAKGTNGAIFMYDIYK